MFAYRLALQLGIPHVEDLLQEMTMTQFLLWKEYYNQEIFGFYADNQRMGHLMALLANIDRDPKKQFKPFKAEDFFTTSPQKQKRKLGKGIQSAKELLFMQQK